MTLGTAYGQDSVAVATNGNINNQTPAQVSTTFGAGNIKTPTRDFTLRINHALVSFRANVPVVTDANMLAAFVAAGAPVV